MVQAFIEHGVKYGQEALGLPAFTPAGQSDRLAVGRVIENLRALLEAQPSEAAASKPDERQEGRSEVVGEVARPKPN